VDSEVSTVSGSESVKTLSFCSPQPLLCDRGSVLRDPSAVFYLPEARVSKQTFARPQRLLPFESHRSEVNAPALSLRHSSELFFQPVRP